MTVALTRVDQRLVHGQVTVAWFAKLGFNAIGVADDAAAGDPLEREMLELGAPSSVSVDVRPAAAGADWYTEDSSVRRLVLVASLASLRELIGAGAEPKSINLGGLHYREGARRYLDYLYLTREDIESLHELAAEGRELFAQELPDSPVHPLNTVLAEGRLAYDHLSSRAP